MTCPRCGREIGEPGVLGRHYVVPAVAAMGCWGCQDDQDWDAKLAAIEAECEANERKSYTRDWIVRAGRSAAVELFEKLDFGLPVPLEVELPDGTRLGGVRIESVKMEFVRWEDE